ncbi:hypothetical protein C7431_103335 [Pantoea allii]|uniref:YubB ferredoxin-like domain-containing protein n=1 Tax=Pantoea allii TaxID=574096 RepID=A0A2V2BIP7_9GAMM|nr:hypothetical protein C7431_103335 [Pantoea allii]
MGQMSQKFDCEIRHYWLSPGAGTSGYNCFDSGDHVDSCPYPEDEVQYPLSEGAPLYQFSAEAGAPATPTVAHYASVRA